MSPGQALAAARHEAGLTVAEVSQKTRIREAIIRSIERDDYSACGGDFYARGHIRAMARAAGADPAPLIREYDAARREPGHDGDASDNTDQLPAIRGPFEPPIAAPAEPTAAFGSLGNFQLVDKRSCEADGASETYEPAGSHGASDFYEAPEVYGPPEAYGPSGLYGTEGVYEAAESYEELTEPTAANGGSGGTSDSGDTSGTGARGGPSGYRRVDELTRDFDTPYKFGTRFDTGEPYEAPSEAYGAPSEPHEAPGAAYRAPGEPYGPPGDLHGTPGEPYGPPGEPYGPPGEPYEAPGAAYRAPGEPYEAPGDLHGPPGEPYGPPREPYGPPGEPYGTPRDPYGPPGEPYQAPGEAYRAPGDLHGPPSEPYGPPGEPYEAPGGIHGAPGEPPSIGGDRSWFLGLTEPPVTGQPARPSGPARPARPVTEPRRPGRWAAVTLVLLAALGLVAYLMLSSSGSTPSASSGSPSGKATAGHQASHSPSPGHTTSPPSSPSHSAPPPPQVLHPVSVVAFGPSGAGQGDDPQDASLAIDHAAGTFWQSDWYATAHFGNLQAGTGLLVDMGHPVTLTGVQVTLGAFRGADLQLRAGSAPTLGSLRKVASAANAGGLVHLHPGAPVTARYLLIWFTKLPPNANGNFQARVYNIKVL
ncbi:MAG TPA: helix-turn-helix domain-containing protein [Streptosporangiaceae bacterium]|nr:helix-turn-helix domain-containing protein [Streptosporangiaceae bacterium]